MDTPTPYEGKSHRQIMDGFAKWLNRIHKRGAIMQCSQECPNEAVWFTRCLQHLPLWCPDHIPTTQDIRKALEEAAKEVYGWAVYLDARTNTVRVFQGYLEGDYAAYQMGEEIKLELSWVKIKPDEGKVYQSALPLRQVFGTRLEAVHKAHDMCNTEVNVWMTQRLVWEQEIARG